MNLYETIISSKTAKLAKKLGFDIPTIGYYLKLADGWEFQTENLDMGPYNWNERKGRSAPSQAVLQTWLRNKFKYSLEVSYRIFAVESGNGFYYNITTLPNNILGHPAEQTMREYYGKDVFNGFTSYEEALEAGLQETIKVLLNGN